MPCSPQEHTQPSSLVSFCPPLLRSFPSKSHPASAASRGCSKHLCSTLSSFTADTHTCPQAGLSQGSRSQAQNPGAGVRARGAHFLSPSTKALGTCLRAPSWQEAHFAVGLFLPSKRYPAQILALLPWRRNAGGSFESTFPGADLPAPPPGCFRQAA